MSGPATARTAPSFSAGHPGDRRTVAEAQDELHAQCNFTLVSPYHADQVRSLPVRNHEIDQRRLAVGGREAGFQNERVLPVAPRDADRVVGRTDQPAPVGWRTEESGEAGIGVKARPAQPVYRAVSSHQGRGTAVANQGIMFDWRTHQSTQEHGAARTFCAVAGCAFQAEYSAFPFRLFCIDDEDPALFRRENGCSVVSFSSKAHDPSDRHDRTGQLAT